LARPDLVAGLVVDRRPIHVCAARAAAWAVAAHEAPARRHEFGRWHTITITPHPGRPKIHFYQKLNPVWWFENFDEPVPPDGTTGGQTRVAKWHFRNPLHNFNNYVIGVADKKFVRSGKYPERNSSPHGGWDFEVARRKLVLLPFISCQRGSFNFYFGWREHGNFGMKFQLFDSTRPRPPTKSANPGRKLRHPNRRPNRSRPPRRNDFFGANCQSGVFIRV